MTLRPSFLPKPSFIYEEAVDPELRGLRSKARSLALTEEEIREIRASEELNVTLAERYGVSTETIGRWRGRRGSGRRPEGRLGRW